MVQVHSVPYSTILSICMQKSLILLFSFLSSFLLFSFLLFSSPFSYALERSRWQNIGEEKSGREKVKVGETQRKKRAFSQDPVSLSESVQTKTASKPWREAGNQRNPAQHKIFPKTLIIVASEDCCWVWCGEGKACNSR